MILKTKVDLKDGGKILDVNGQGGWGVLKIEQFSWTLYVYYPLKDFHCKSAGANNIIYERNYWFFNNNEFKNDLQSIPCQNILSQVNLSASSAFGMFFKQINTLLDEHTPIHKISRKELSLKKKLWISKIIQSLMRERDRLFKSHCQETNPTVKLTKHDDYQRIRNIVVSKIKLKTARVKPIFNKDNSQIPSNYSPISMLSVISKLYKKSMYSRLYSFLTKYKMLLKKQFGFRNNHSTIHALISLVDLIKKHLDNDFLVCGIFIDVQKAFNTVNHDILLAKLDHYGIRGLANSWLSSSLKNRTQYVYL